MWGGDKIDDAQVLGSDADEAAFASLRSIKVKDTPKEKTQPPSWKEPDSFAQDSAYAGGAEQLVEPTQTEGDSDVFAGQGEKDFEFPSNEKKEDEPKFTGQEICVSSGNSKLASVFRTGDFAKYGSGAYRYHWQRSPCGLHPGSPPSIHLQYVSEFKKPTSSGKAAPKPSMVVIAGDEFCKCAYDVCTNNALVQARQYHNAWYGSSVPYLPLGARYEFKPVVASEIIATSSRKYDFNLMVSVTSKSRWTVSNVAKTMQNGFINVAAKFVRDPENSDQHVKPAEYRAVMLDSKFTLCPMGHNPEAYRLYEAIEAGSIPIIAVDADYKRHPCKDPFGPMLKSDFPGVVLDSWTDLPEVMKSLLEDPSALDDMQTRLAAWKVSFMGNAVSEFETALASSQLLAVTAMPYAIPLVTGCGRGGTLSIATYLNSVGVKAVHEDVKKGYVSVSWLYAANAASYPFEGKGSRTLRAGRGYTFSPVVHLVRHPMKVISSTRRCFCGRGTRKTKAGRKSDLKSWQFVDAVVEQYLPLDAQFRIADPVDSLRRSMAYWLGWNKMIEARFNRPARVLLESMNPSELLSVLGVKPTKQASSKVKSSAAHVSPESEKKALPDVTWEDMVAADPSMANEIRALASKYGYRDIAIYPPETPPPAAAPGNNNMPPLIAQVSTKKPTASPTTKKPTKEPTKKPTRSPTKKPTRKKDRIFA